MFLVDAVGINITVKVQTYMILHAAQELGTRDGGWPDQYVAVPRQDSLWREDRTAAGEGA